MLSVRPSVPKSCPEHNSETISYFQTKLDIFIDQDLNWCLLLFIDSDFIHFAISMVIICRKQDMPWRGYEYFMLVIIVIYFFILVY